MRIKIEDYKERIEELYFKERMTSPNVAKELGIHRESVMKIVRQNPNYKPYMNGNPTIRKHKLNEEFFDVIDTEEKAYIFGLLCADGHVADAGLHFAVADKDIELYEKVRDAMGSDQPFRYFRKKSQFSYGKEYFDHVALKMNSRKMVKRLRELGIPANKTYTLTAEVMNNVPEELRDHFARGYFDGDGGIYMYDNVGKGNDFKTKVSIMGNRDFIKRVFDNRYETNDEIRYDPKTKQSYNWGISRKSLIIRFGNRIYKDATIYMERKYRIYAELKQREIKRLQDELAYIQG